MTDKQFFAPRRLGHVNLWTNDLAASETFYRDICGLNVEFTEPGLVASFLGTGHTPHDLGLIEKTGGEARLGRDGTVVLPAGIGFEAGLNHLAWELYNEADLVRAYRALLSTDVAVDLTVDHQIAHSVYLRDPDGNQIEFYCDTVRDWRKVLHGEMDLITSHWNPLGRTASTDTFFETEPELRNASAALVKPWRLHHVVLETPQLSQMVKFYTSIGGLEPRGTAFNGSVVLLGGSLHIYDFNLALVHGTRPGYHHVAFELASAEEFTRARAGLVEHGVAIESEFDAPWKRSIFLKDRDGQRVEFYLRGDVNARHTEVPAAQIAYAV